MKPTWPRLLGAVALAALLGLSAQALETAPAKASETVKPAGPSVAAVKPPLPTLATLLAPPMPEGEKKLHDLVLDGLKSTESGSREFLKGKKPVELSARQVGAAALQKSLSVQVQGHAAEIAQAFLYEMQAAFLPVFDVGVDYDWNKVFSRKRLALVSKRPDPASFVPPLPSPRDWEDNTGKSPIRAIRFMAGFKVLVEDTQYASRHQSFHADNSTTFSASVTQLLPWGPSLSVAIIPTLHKTYYDKQGHDYDAPWATSIAASLVLPVPFTKNWGPYAPQDLAIKLARHDRDAAIWDLRAVMNASIQSADLTYWDLVTAMKNIETTSESLKVVKTVLDKTKELRQANQVTDYAVAQMEGQYQTALGQVESAWLVYVAVSDRLVELLNLAPGSVVVPVGYSRLMDERLAFTPEEAVKTGLANRPELRAAAIRTQRAETELKGAEVADLPDMTLSSNVTLAQSSSVMGFRTLDQSLYNLGKMRYDSRNQNYAFTYVRPLFNRAADAVVEQKSLARQAQTISQLSVENNVAWEIHSAVSGVSFARSALEAAKARREMAKKALDLAQEEFNKANLTAFEMIAKIQDLLDAENGLVAAQASCKKAETSLTGAEGALPGKYPEMTAEGEFEKYRLELLKSYQVLPLLGGGK